VPITGKRLLCALGALTMSLWLAAPAAADDDDNQMPACSLGPLCNMLPITDLDHDIDLTKDQPPVPDQDLGPPVNPCSAGCS
jgi:hypothetical protein